MKSKSIFISLSIFVCQCQRKMLRKWEQIFGFMAFMGRCFVVLNLFILLHLHLSLSIARARRVSVYLSSFAASSNFTCEHLLSSFIALLQLNCFRILQLAHKYISVNCIRVLVFFLLSTEFLRAFFIQNFICFSLNFCNTIKN